MIKCIIIDDEPLAQNILETYISDSPELRLVKICSNAVEAFHTINTEPIDLMFLDIIMPSINGLDFVKSLKEPPAVIFTTAFSAHAIDSYELEAIDYLLKPITFSRFQKSLDKLKKIHKQDIVPEKNYIYFKTSGKLIKVMHEDFLFAQCVKDYILVQTKKGNYLVHMTMKYLNDLLPKNIFIRVHRSYFINKNFISLINKNHIILHGNEIPIGEKYRNLFQDNNWISKL